MTGRARNDLLNKAYFKEQKGIKILHLKGSPYEMGYQHGHLLAAKIELMVKRTLLATAAYAAQQTGSDLERAEEMICIGQQKAEPFIPREFKDEMRGIADGAKDAGADVTMQDILLWNTNYDQWCIYAHPHYWQCDGKSNTHGKTNSKANSPIPVTSGGCSSFCAWDEWAGGDGKLIFGKNEDNFNMPEQLDNRMMVIADPDEGFGHAFMTYPGMIGLDGGLNEDGLEMMTQLNSMQDESMQGCGIAIFTRYLLTHAGTVDDAIKIFRDTPRAAGIAYHVADAKSKEAAVVETSSKMVSVRYPMENVKALWQTNHSNCYPGWMGYSGYNMVADQVKVNALKDISTIENWQNSLKDPYNFYVQAPSRFERYGQLIHQYYGRINVENAIKILSDCYDPYTRMVRPINFPSWTNNILCTICALYPDFAYQAKEPVGKFKAHIANMWSLIAYPETGDLWLAIKDFPAQYGGYEYFNLREMLSSLR
ncbi:MAG: C45 family autoproteolytic acyltransferase/hydrolase [Methanothrix sp.]|nr:C45 family autoproteolytic acyltransferase/hydrolase [Methanothrix sp.]